MFAFSKRVLFCAAQPAVEMGKLTSTIGIPIKLLNEAQVRCGSPCEDHCFLCRSGKNNIELEEAFLIALADRSLLPQGHVVTLEITSGVVYRGKLLEGA